MSVLVAAHFLDRAEAHLARSEFEAAREALKAARDAIHNIPPVHPARHDLVTTYYALMEALVRAQS